MSTVVIVVSLALAAWGLLAAALNRPPDRVQQIGTIVLTVCVAVLIGSHFADWHPQEAATYVGYALTSLAMPYGAWVLAKLEPTRFGSLIVGVAALIMPVLVVRMGQVWGA